MVWQHDLMMSHDLTYIRLASSVYLFEKAVTHFIFVLKS